MKKRLIALILFGAAFGFVEAAVVYYLRGLLGYQIGYPLGTPHQILNLGLIDFVRTNADFLGKPEILRAEIIREAATIIMLGAVAFLSAKRMRQRVGAFLISFALWDLTYYLFLKGLTGWPVSFWDIDVYFLIPVTWVGPVITPVVSSIVILAVGLKLFLKKFRG